MDGINGRVINGRHLWTALIDVSLMDVINGRH
jgi:hypothetical protein